MHISAHPYKILIIRGSGPGKTNALINSVNTQQTLIKYIYIFPVWRKISIFN